MRVPAEQTLLAAECDCSAVQRKLHAHRTGCPAGSLPASAVPARVLPLDAHALLLPMLPSAPGLGGVRRHKPLAPARAMQPKDSGQALFP